MAPGASATVRSLQYTPTWAVAVVCFVIIFISILIEHSIHLLSSWLKKRRKKALIEAVEKLKSELMVLGFISLLLVLAQKPVSSICIPIKVAETMLPCHKITKTTTVKLGVFEHLKSGNSRNFISIDDDYEDSPWHPERRLASTDSANSDPCSSKGKVSLVTQDGIQQLHIFIFVLAVMQLIYSLLTMALGRAKMRRWKHWEKETQTTEYQVANDPRRFRFTRQTTFGRRHMNTFADTSVLLWTKCFFRQFFNSVAKVDYLTLRHGFISAHLSTNITTFNFQKYIKRSLEDDFRVVVGISPPLWLMVVIFLLVDVHGWHVYLGLPYVPLIIVLVLGTKLEVVVARMALQLKDQNSVINGVPVVQPNDDLFWFSHPRFVLTLLHLTLFMNAYELAFFIWVTYEFGLKSCFHEHIEIIITRVVLAVAVQVICSYITLPLYALVTQMGSHYKSAVLEEQTVHAIKQWHTEVKKKRKKQQSQNPNSEIGSTSHYSHNPNSELGSTSHYSHNPNSEVENTRNTSPTPTVVEIIIPSPSRDEISEVHEEPSLVSIPSLRVKFEPPVVR